MREAIASNHSGRPPKYPFRSMKLGDSFFVSIGGNDPENVRKSIWVCAKSALGRSGLISTRTVKVKNNLGFRVKRIDPRETKRQNSKPKNVAKTKCNKLRNKAILLLVAKGGTYSSVAKVVGVSRATVAGVVYREGRK